MLPRHVGHSLSVGELSMQPVKRWQRDEHVDIHMKAT